ncbi:S1 family peptidase [Roseibium aggregatum]|uniref:S1 family peptidase n=1 Tax=Roseibium aggregatum TaxID=187304 RepID=UPI0025ACEEFD|nr:serine protease [Roseibium aggregatum]WJS05216.1 serine protease [Roseibium aggregatum]
MLSVGIGKPGEYDVLGSAAMVAPGIALSAWHVFEPFMAEIKSGEREVLLHAILDGGLQLWRVEEISQFDATDIIILRINLASDFPEKNKFEACVISTRTPALGEHVMIAGFRRETVECEEDEAKVVGAVRIAIGEVTAVYNSGRDRVLQPNPCVELRCPALGSMSGGPAFDKSGHLIGVLGSSLECEENYEDGPSYVCSAWPILGTKISTVWLNGLVPLPTSLLAMAEQHKAKIIGPEALRVRPDGIEYSCWT